MNKKIILGLIVAVYLFDIFVASTHFGGKDNNLFLNVCLGICQLFAIFSGLYTVFILGVKNRTGKAVLFFSLGLIANFTGSSIFAFYDFTSGVVGFPSVADIFILCGYPLFLLGLIAQLTSGKLFITRSNKLLLGIVSSLLAVVIIYFGIILPFDPAAPFLVNFVQTLYGLADLVLILVFVFVLLLAFEYRGGRFFYPWFLLFLGVVVTLFGDVLFAVFTKDYLAKAGIHQFIDLVWCLAYVFYAYGLLNLGTIIISVQRDIMQKIRLETERTKGSTLINH